MMANGPGVEGDLQATHYLLAWAVEWLDHMGTQQQPPHEGSQQVQVGRAYPYNPIPGPLQELLSPFQSTGTAARATGTQQQLQVSKYKLVMCTPIFLEFGGSSDFHLELLEAFPKLKQAGRYELLRTSEHSKNAVIPPPSGGYTAQYLKAVVSQAKVYVQPLQHSLSPETVSGCEDVSTN